MVCFSFVGTIYSSSLFPNRAPAGRVLLLNYIGGATNTGIVSKVNNSLSNLLPLFYDYDVFTVKRKLFVL